MKEPYISPGETLPKFFFMVFKIFINLVRFFIYVSNVSGTALLFRVKKNQLATKIYSHLKQIPLIFSYIFQHIHFPKSY